jgi:hypothetical protein
MRCRASPQIKVSRLLPLAAEVALPDLRTARAASSVLGTLNRWKLRAADGFKFHSVDRHKLPMRRMDAGAEFRPMQSIELLPSNAMCERATDFAGSLQLAPRCFAELPESREI